LSATALALVLAAALLHATWNFIAKKSGGDVRFALLSSVFQGLIWAPVGLWFAFKHVPGWGWREWGLILASGAIHVLYFVCLLRGYRKADLSVVYPLARGTGPLIAALGAVLLLGEQISALGAAGIGGVVLGVFLIAGGPGLIRTATHAHDAGARQRVLVGVGYGALTGVFIAAYTVVDGYAVKVALISPILVDYLGGVVRIPMLLPLIGRELKTLPEVFRSQWKNALVVGTLGPIAYTLVLFAMTLAPLSHVAPAREVSMLFAALLGGKLLGEQDLGLRLAGAALIAGGVIALALG
jgi:drug/metabolite transporter (DMT)-like permease